MTTQERPRKRTGRRRTRWPWLALAAACAVLAAAVLPGRLFGGGRGERLDRSVFDRQDLIYGAQIGAWDLDGGLVTTDPTAGRRVVDAGIRVIAAGLDQDYMRQPFGPMPALLAVAEEVSKMHAVCVRCRGAAHYSQRVSGGNAQVEVGDSSYEARCRSCYELYKAEAEERQEPVVQLTMPQPV